MFGTRSREYARLTTRDHPADTPGYRLAYVPQECPFFSNLTVRETIQLAARLRRAGGGAGEEEEGAEGEVDRLIFRLGLETCADTLVGGDTGGHYVTGISGGEKRRLAIACEIAGASRSPAILIADEPTSGLDSFQADKVAEILSDIATGNGSIVVCSMHQVRTCSRRAGRSGGLTRKNQPRSAILDRIDDVLVLSPGGKVCYTGEMAGALPYFEDLEFVCPNHHNPAEFMIDLVSRNTNSKAEEAASEARIRRLQAAWADKRRREAGGGAAAPEVDAGGAKEKSVATRKAGARGRPFGRHFRLLFGRVFKQVRRDRWTHAARAVSSVVLGLAFGASNFRLGRTQKSIKSRAALMFQLCITSSMISIVKTLNSFPRERVTVSREMARDKGEAGAGGGGYGVGAYFLSKLLVETPVDALFPVLFGLIVGPLARLNAARQKEFLAVIAASSMAASSLGLSIGAICPTVDTALALGPSLMTVSIMVADQSGMFGEVPAFMQPLSNVSIVRWGFEGCMAAEMKGLTFAVDDTAMPKMGTAAAAGPGDAAASPLERFLRGFTAEGKERAARRKAVEQMAIPDGENVLEGLGISPETGVRGSIRASLAISAGNALLAFLAMAAQGKESGFKAQPLLEPEGEAGGEGGR